MFPIGTILFIIDAGNGSLGVNNCIVQVIEKPKFERIHGRNGDGFFVKILEYSSERMAQMYGPYWKLREEGIYISYNKRLPFKDWKESVLVAKQFLI